MLWTPLSHVLGTPVCATCTLRFYESTASKTCPRRVGDARLTFDVAHDSVCLACLRHNTNLGVACLRHNANLG